MALIEINRDPSARELRWFGGLFAIFFAVIGGVVRWSWHAPTAAAIIWCAAGGVTFLFAAVPPVRRPLYLAWMYAAFPIGWVISHTLLATVYYGVLTPIGLVMRWCGIDPLDRSLDRQRSSYWVEREQAADKSRYFRQF